MKDDGLIKIRFLILWKAQVRDVKHAGFESHLVFARKLEIFQNQKTGLRAARKPVFGFVFFAKNICHY
jgi:hypothetical protein